MNPDPWHVFRAAPQTYAIVLRSGSALTTRDVCAEAAALRARLDRNTAPLFLYCEDAGNFLAGFLAALASGRELHLPGHAAPAYLREIGAMGQQLITDVAGLDKDALIVAVKPAAPDARVDFQAPDPATRISFFTSGSTAEPKPCAKTLAQLLAEVRVHLELWGSPGGPVVGTVSHQHIYGLLFRVLWPVWGGAAIIGPRQETWEAVAHVSQPGSPLIASPAHLARIPEGVAFPHRPSLVFSSGGPLSFEAAGNAAAALGSYPIEVLGSTETGGVAWRRQEAPEAMWTPLPQVEIRQGPEGALLVRSPFTGLADFLPMGDRMEFGQDGRFALKARLDRVVKVEGKRVSLPRVEQALRALHDIADAVVVDLPERNGALGAVVVLEQAGEKQLVQMGRFRYSRLVRRLLADVLEPMERPRYWRFVPRIPENAQGKRIVGDLRNLFMTAAPEMPTVTSRDVDGDKARFDLELDPDLRWFDGHFPAQPILPGVAQLHIAAAMAEEAWGAPVTGREMSRVKFRQVMQPGDRITLALERKGEARIEFRYERGGEITASGALKGGAS